MTTGHKIKKPRIVERAQKLSFLFFWLRWFYRDSNGIPIAYQLYTFFPQKILRINGAVGWPVHFTSRVLFYRNISIGNGSPLGLNSGCYIQGRAGIVVGHNCRMGPGVGLISSNHDLNDYDQWDYSEPIRIGDNVWIGMNTVVMPGVQIGDNVVIGANSVVSSNIESNSIAVGSPCKIIRKKDAYQGRDYSKI